MIDMRDQKRSAKSRGILTTLLLAVLAATLLLFNGCGSRNSAPTEQSLNSGSQITYNDSASTTKAELGGEDGAISFDRKTIENAELNIRVQDVAAAADQIIALSNVNGGYTVSSHIYGEDQTVSGRLSIKVPQANLVSVIASIANMGEVTDKTITTQDVTEEYYDSEARLKVLQAKEERLLGLMDQAANITEIISIENELSKTRSEIEVLSGRLQYLTNATTYSLINITLGQGLPGTIQAPQGTLGRSWQGFVSSISGLINFASGTVVFLFTALPWLAVLAILFLLGRYVYRKIRVGRNRQ